MEVRRLENDKRGEFVFGVETQGHRYVTYFSGDYYQKLTGGKITPEELVKKSFEFLLAHESPDSILPEFNLTVIAGFYPDFESTLQK